MGTWNLAWNFELETRHSLDSRVLSGKILLRVLNFFLPRYVPFRRNYAFDKHNLYSSFFLQRLLKALDRCARKMRISKPRGPPPPNSLKGYKTTATPQSGNSTLKPPYQGGPLRARKCVIPSGWSEKHGTRILWRKFNHTGSYLNFRVVEYLTYH